MILGMSCYCLADTIFIANGVGVNGLTALNLVIERIKKGVNKIKLFKYNDAVGKIV